MATDNPFGEKYQKYWDTRYRKFSKFDEGIEMDLESLYSTGPEEISKKIARRTGAKTVVDGFACVGGSTIGFATYAEHVFAIELDHHRIEMAKHNLAVYGLADKVTFIEGDFLKEAPSLSAEAVFIDPPWGGPDYSLLETFTLDHFSPNGRELLEVAFRHFLKVVLRVPRNFDMKELDPFGKAYVVDNEMDGEKIIFKTVYFFTPENI